MLRESLLSLVSQRTSRGEPVAVEVIVIDNGSSDGSVEMVTEEFQGVRLIANSANLGFCRANNQGIATATGGLIALLNNDAVADSLWLDRLRIAIEVDRQYGMAASKVLDYYDPVRIDKVGHLIYPDGQNRGRGGGEVDGGQYDKLVDPLWPDGCAAMYRKTMLDEIGCFDEDLFAYGDDAELGLRARIAGWRCTLAPDAIVRHRRGETLGRGNPARVTLIERNRILLAAKLFPWSMLLLNPLYFTLRIFRDSNAADLRDFPGIGGKLRVALALARGALGALGMLPMTLRKRASVARMAKLSSAEIRALIFRGAL